MEQSETHYGSTEAEEHAQKSTVVWEIVSEITSFGVTEKQILLIIKRLALNLENDNHMRKIAKLIDEIQEEGLVESTELILSE